MHQPIYDRLLELASNRLLTSYSDIAPLAGLDMNAEKDRKKMSELLEEIARFEHGENRPMLTALVIHRGNDNNPGEGFFAIALELGLFQGSRDDIMRTTFWTQQVADVHAHWRKTRGNI
jgi:hypothetical protein